MKNFAKLLCLVLCLTLVLTAASVARAESGAPDELAYTGTITMYAQALSPDEPTETNPNPPTAFRTVAEEYQKLHPGITIEFIPQLTGGQDYLTWLKTRIAGGQAPDIFWTHASQINGGYIPTGSTVELSEYLERPNKYIEGNEKWIDTFYESVLATNRGPNGEQPVINADYVGTAVYYNKELFDKAGIDMSKTPETWAEYVAICDQLKAAGITPWAFSFGNNQDDTSYVNWFTRLFNTNFYYDEFEELKCIDPNKSTLNIAEVVVGFKNGYFGVDNPKWLAWWDLMKEQVKNYMPNDSISAASTRDTVASMFYNQQIAMIWEGSWAVRNFQNANISFEYGSFPFPYPTSESSEYATDFNSAGCVGGPLAAFQYAISTERANSTMTNDKLEACIDWLMYCTTPENDSLICNDNMSFIPTIKGSTPLEANAGLVSLLEEDPVVIDDGMMTLGNELLDVYYRTFQQYLQDQVTMDQAKEILRPAVEEALEDAMDNIEMDLTPYIKTAETAE